MTDSQHIDAEGVLQPGLFIEHIDEILHIRISAQFDHDPDAFLGRLVHDIHDVLRLFRLRKGRHIGQKLTDAHADHRVGNLGDDHVRLATLPLLDLHLAPQFHLAHAGLIDLRQLILVDHNAAGGKIRSLHIPHQFPGGDVIVMHVGLDCVDHLPQIVGRNAGGHAYGDALRTVN